MPVAPRIGSAWVHTNGNKYRVIGIANRDSQHLDKYPVTVVYVGPNGKMWARSLEDWYRSMTQLEDTFLQETGDADTSLG